MVTEPSHLQIPSELSAAPLQSLSTPVVQFREPGAAGSVLHVAFPPEEGHTTVPERKHAPVPPLQAPPTGTPL